MNFFKNFFKKDKPTIQDVFRALDNFDNSIKTLNTFTDLAFNYFGSNWKFNIEMFITTLEPEDKKKFSDKFKMVLEYEKALSIWTSALQIVKGAKPVSAELLKSMPEYKDYLLKFGIEGERLYQKLNSMFELSKNGEENANVPADIAPAEETSKPTQSNDSQEHNDDIVVKDSSSDLTEDSVEIVESVVEDSPADVVDVDTDSGTDSEDNNDVVDDNDDEESQVSEPSTPSVDYEKNDYRDKLKQRILQKVRDIEERKKVQSQSTASPINIAPIIEESQIAEDSSKTVSPAEDSSKTVSPAEDSSKTISPTEDSENSVSDSSSKESKNDEKQDIKPNISQKHQSITQVNTDWILKNFKKIENFLSQSREIMSAISLYKKAQSIEEYKNYGFIVDIVDYLIEKGEEILSTKSDEEIENVFAGGRNELRDIILSYKAEKNNEVIIVDSSQDTPKKPA